MKPSHPSDPPLRRVELSGSISLTYTDEGQTPRDGGLTFVGLAGLPGGTRDWRWLGAELEQGARFVRLNLPGFEGSSWPDDRPMTLEERAGFISEALDALALESVFLLGHSMGGGVATAVASARPDVVRYLGLIASISTHPHYPKNLYELIARVYRVPLVWQVLLPIYRRILVMLGFSQNLEDAEITRTMLDVGATDHDAHTERLRNMETPTLVAWASDDHIIPEAFFEELADVAPKGARLRFPEGGHNIQKTQAVELAATLLGLAEEVDLATHF